jgi:hypothetical protein
LPWHWRSRSRLPSNPLDFPFLMAVKNCSSPIAYASFITG